MSKLLVFILRWAAKKVLILFCVLAVLVFGAWMKTEWEAYRGAKQNITKQEAMVKDLDDALSKINGKIQETASDTQRLTEKWTNAQKVSAENWRRVATIQEEVEYWNRHPFQWMFSIKNRAARAAAIESLPAARAVAEKFDRVRIEIKKQVSNSEGSHLILEKAKLEQQRNDLEARLEAEREAVRKNPRQRVIAEIEKQLPTALGILLGIILMPILIKAVFFYVFAPIAAKLPPVQIIDPSKVTDVPRASASAVSISIVLDPGQEVLVLPDYLQSCDNSSEKFTQWFLNPRLPLSSIASGLTMLTAVRPKGGRATRVVVSAQTDPLGEVGVVELPIGSAMVIQPRSLVGVVKFDRDQVRITRHWRLRSLHSWLTLQLRFLVFHGPCKLILKGCRGIVSEEPNPGGGRMINQDATIGFSANLEFRNTRCETFLSYFRGKEALFNDQFSGGPGIFVYEEMPGGGRKSGIMGRGMEGLVDAALKAFGI